MRLGIDVREIENGVSTGIGRSLYNFLRYVSQSHHNDHVILFSSRPLPFSFGPRIENVVMSEDSRRLWDQVKLPLALRNQMIEVFYSPYYKVPLWTSSRCVSSVLDLIYLRFEPYRKTMSLFATLYYKTFGRMCLNKAVKVLTCSQFSKSDIIGVYGIDRKKIEVIPLSVSAAYRPEADPARLEAVREQFGIRRKFVLYSGNFKAHKNVSALIDAFAQMVKLEDLELVLVSPKTAGYAEIRGLAEKLGVLGRVIFTDRVTEEETMRALYSAAGLFVMPSLYEGFGLPPIEAMACGTPVVCSNATSLPEVVGDAAVLVDARNPAEIAQAALTVLTDEVLRKGMVREGLLRAAQFSENTISRRLFDVLRDITG